MRRIHNAFPKRNTVLYAVRKSAERLIACGVAFAVLTASGGAEAPAGQPVDGIRCEAAEGAVLHIHQHLAIYDRGAAVAIPSDIGRPLFAPCLYWLHTHTSDGLIHVESPLRKTFTLGEFFDIWGKPLSRTRVADVRVPPGRLHVFLNGSPFARNPRDIQLSEHADITLEAGPPYHKPPAFTDWNGQ